MPRFEVARSGGESVEVEASTWLSALGEGLLMMGLLGGIDRLACEVLPNGRVLARDVRSGQGYAVSGLSPTRSGLSPTSSASASAPPRRAPPEEGTHSLDGMIFEGEEDDGEPLADERDELADDPSTNVLLAALRELAGEARTDAYPPSDLGPGETSSATTLVMEFLDRVRSAPSNLMAWHEALDAAQALIPSEAGAAMELEDDERLRFLHAYGPRSRGVQGAVMPRDTGIAGFAVRRVASMLVTDTKADPRFCSDFDEVTGFSTWAVICVPVAMEGRVFGCLELLNPLSPGGFDRAQVELVELIAGSLAERLMAP